MQLAHWLSHAEIFEMMIDALNAHRLANKTSIKLGELGYKKLNIWSEDQSDDEIPPSSSFKIKAICDAYTLWSQAYVQNPAQPLKEAIDNIITEQINLPAHYLLKCIKNFWNAGYQQIMRIKVSCSQEERESIYAAVQANIPADLKSIKGLTIIWNLTKSLINESLESISYTDLKVVAPHVAPLKGIASSLPSHIPPPLERGKRFTEGSVFFLDQLIQFIEKIDRESKEQIEAKLAAFSSSF